MATKGSWGTDADSFYAGVDESQREALLKAYIDYLTERNGELDRETGTLPRREASLAQMNAAEIRFEGEILQADFDRLYANFDASAPELTPELLLLLTFCKMNAGEAYGVRVVRAVHERRDQNPSSPRGQAILFAQEEEEYHTRILVGAALNFDIQVEGVYLPKLPLKVLIHAIAYAPRPLFHPILYGAEVAGVYSFNWTLNRIAASIKGQPALREALEERLIEILVDEIGHVAFNRLAMGERWLGVGRYLAGQTVRGMPLITPELGALGFDRSVERAFANFDLGDLPEEARKHAFFA